MAMKTPHDPRRVYSTRGTLALCYEGHLYGFTGEGESALRKDVPASVVESTDEGGIVVKQRRPHSKAIVETWFPL